MSARKAKEVAPENVPTVEETRRVTVRLNDTAIVAKARDELLAQKGIDVSGWNVESVVTGDDGLISVTFATVNADPPSA